MKQQQTGTQAGTTDDSRAMSAFQYKQELNRTIRMFGSFAVAYALRRNSLSTQLGHFSLGRWGGWIAGGAIGWLVLIIAVLTIPQEFHSATKMTGVLCLVGVVFYWCVIRRRIQRGDAGIHATDTSSFTV